ncbi:hypothetical protein [Polyangium spumosum]|uniref:Uncharacterized protein n=1 Tax=Polyangium spumosum TaxID=889282 RepID=A0A6N7Q121_9BACT|nr:hypothetical protein [Polyangium spumosum]MRG96490.1 hypothetical protein [Polyangium spumosum]
MAIDWTDEERKKVEAGIAKHGLRTGRCAALARIVHPVAQQKDPKACAIRMRPPKGATWLVPKASSIPSWKGHVYVETREHAVDAVTGSKGYSPSSTYVNDHWDFAEWMRIDEVDPATVDPGIQDVDDES